MPIRPLFFWIKRWIVKICPKYTRYPLSLSGLQRFCEGCEREKSIISYYARARELENLDVLMSCRKMLIASSVTLHVCSITLPSSF